jgi:tricorn protease-like protein
MCVLPLCVLAAGCDDKKEAVGLSYHVMLDKAFNEKGTGRVVPLTIEKGVEMDASISGDSRFMIYSSDRDRGNFDIYLRVLNDIATVRLTGHASRDIQPALSPDGKKLVLYHCAKIRRGSFCHEY